jgi:hypothetical protein
MPDATALEVSDSQKTDPISRLTHAHDAILDWLLMNPTATLTQMGEALGYSPPWLSLVINSDLFQAKYAERRQTIEASIASDIPAKMRVIAQLGLEKLADKIARTQDAEFLLETTDKMLHRLGYAPSKGPTTVQQTNVQTNVYAVDAATLAKHRERIVEQSLAATKTLPQAPAAGVSLLAEKAMLDV